MNKPVIIKDFHGHHTRVGDKVTLLVKRYGFRGIDRAYLLDCTYNGKSQYGYEFSYTYASEKPGVIRVREPQFLRTFKVRGR